MLRARQQLLFVLKLLAAYAVWFVVYDCWLHPAGTVDVGLSRLTASASGSLLALLGFDAVASGQTLWVHGPSTAGIELVAGCNGLSSMGLFSGFVAAYPGSAVRRAYFIPLGAAVILMANVVRNATLAALQVYLPGVFGFMHSLGTTMIFYVVIFGLWVVWIRYGRAGHGEATLEAR